MLNPISIFLTSDQQWAEKHLRVSVLAEIKYQVFVLWRVDDVACIFVPLHTSPSCFLPHAVVWTQLVGFYSNSCVPTNLLDSDCTLESVLLCCLDLDSIDVSVCGEHGLFQTAQSSLLTSCYPVKPCINYALLFMHWTCILKLLHITCTSITKITICSSYSAKAYYVLLHVTFGTIQKTNWSVRL